VPDQLPISASAPGCRDAAPSKSGDLMLPPPQKKFLPSTRYTSAMVRLRTKKSVGDVTAASCRFCCKSPKWPGANFPAVKKSDRRPRIDVAPITLPRSPASLSSRNEVPHIFTRKSRVQPKEILSRVQKRLLQQNRHTTAVPFGRTYCRYRRCCGLSKCLARVGLNLLGLDTRKFDHVAELFDLI
jgi:hypothetical protein